MGPSRKFLLIALAGFVLLSCLSSQVSNSTNKQELSPEIKEQDNHSVKHSNHEETSHNHKEKSNSPHEKNHDHNENHHHHKQHSTSSSESLPADHPAIQKENKGPQETSHQESKNGEKIKGNTKTEEHIENPLPPNKVDEVEKTNSTSVSHHTENGPKVHDHKHGSKSKKQKAVKNSTHHQAHTNDSHTLSPHSNQSNLNVSTQGSQTTPRTTEPHAAPNHNHTEHIHGNKTHGHHNVSNHHANKTHIVGHHQDNITQVTNQSHTLAVPHNQSTQEHIGEILTFFNFNLSSDVMKGHINASREYNSRVSRQRSYEDLYYNSRRINNLTIAAQNVTAPLMNSSVIPPQHNLSKSINATKVRYTIPQHTKLSKAERRRLRYKLAKHAEKLRQAKKHAKYSLRKQTKNAHKRMHHIYKKLKHKYHNHHERKAILKHQYEKQKHHIEASYKHAEQKIRHASVKALDHYARHHGFEVRDGSEEQSDSGLSEAQFEFEQEINKTLTKELAKIEHLRNRELHHLDKHAHNDAKKLHVNLVKGEETSPQAHALLKINSTVVPNTDANTKSDVKSKIQSANIKIVVYLSTVILCVAIAGIFLSYNRKKESIFKKVDDLESEVAYDLMR